MLVMLVGTKITGIQIISGKLITIFSTKINKINHVYLTYNQLEAKSTITNHGMFIR